MITERRRSCTSSRLCNQEWSSKTSRSQLFTFQEVHRGWEGFVRRKDKAIQIQSKSRIVISWHRSRICSKGGEVLNLSLSLSQSISLFFCSFQPDFDIQTPPQLVTFLLQKYASDSERSGIKIAELKDSYPNAKEAVEELSKKEPSEDREVLVIRGAKDGAPKTVFWNPLSGPEAKGVDQGESGFSLFLWKMINRNIRHFHFFAEVFWSQSSFGFSSCPSFVSPEFRDLWASIKTPDAVDRARDLAAHGLSSTSSQTASGSRGTFRGGKRGGRGGRGGSANRKVKIQNTHLEGVDLTKDFSG